MRVGHVSVNAVAIEAHYRKSPFVKEVCVTSIDGELYAVVVPNLAVMRERRIVNVGDLLRFEIEGLSHQLPADSRVRGYEIWFEPLPRTAAQEIERGEIDRRVRERQRTAQDEDALLPEAEQTWLGQAQAAAVVPLIQARAKRGARIRPDANLELDLGLDSIDRVQLLIEIEHRFGATIAQATAAEIFTVRHLVDALRSTSALRAPADQVAGTSQPWATIVRDRDLPEMTWLLRKRTFTAPLLWLLLRMARTLFVRVRVQGLENLPASGPYIVSPNHQSYVDPFVLCGVLPYRVFRDLFFVGAVEYFEAPFTRALARAANLVPVDPDSNLIPAMEAGAFGLSHGKILVVFPEGERSIDGTVKKFKKGAPILAQHLGVPIVPVALRGIHELWPRTGRINWSLVAPWSGHRVSIEIGAPLSLPECADYQDSATALRSRISEMWEALST
jgi:long-chain acyl-CoA synthetase